MTFGNSARLDPVSVAWNTVASYPTYDQAQAAVDRLADERFPVENLEIIGSDLRLVEQVTGRMTNARAAQAGAAGGAWFGLFIGVLVGLFSRGAVWIGLIIGGILIGAIWGAIFGYLSHWVTRGKRDFASTRSIVAARYDIIARGGRAEAAREVLRSAGIDLGSPPAGPASEGADRAT